MNLLTLKSDIANIAKSLEKSDKVFVLRDQFDAYLKAGGSPKLLARLLTQYGICMDFAVKARKLYYQGTEIWTLENDHDEFHELRYIRRIGTTYIIYVIDHYYSSDYDDFGATKTENIMLLFQDGKVTKL